MSIPTQSGYYWLRINKEWEIAWVIVNCDLSGAEIQRTGSHQDFFDDEVKEWGPKIKRPEPFPPFSGGIDAKEPPPNDIHIKISGHIAQYLNGQEWCNLQTQQHDVYG